jgi:hypothetical protein
MPQTPYNAPVAVTYYHITAPGTFVVKAAPGQLFAINSNALTGTVASVSFFDQATTATGTVGIAVMNFGTANVLPSRLDIGSAYAGINFKTGLVAVVTGTIDTTVSFR